MFDEQPPKTSEAPGNVPSEPADMFAGVKDAPDDSDRLPDALSSGLLRKKESSLSVMPDVSGGHQGVAFQSSGSSVGAKIMITLLVVIVIGGFGFGGWWLYQTSQDKTSALPKAPAEEVPVTQPAVIPAAVEPAPIVSTSSTTRSNNDDILFGTSVDSDKDGIDDVRERESGTDPVRKDTDGDELSDGDEVLIWHTDPLKVDTDGDTYPDGEEVKNGYNPLGRGRMIPVPTTTTQAVDAI